MRRYRRGFNCEVANPVDLWRVFDGVVSIAIQGVEKPHLLSDKWADLVVGAFKIVTAQAARAVRR